MQKTPSPYRLRVDKENQLLALSFPQMKDPDNQPVFLTYQQAASLTRSLSRFLAEAEDIPTKVTENQMDKTIRSLENILIELRSMRGLLESAFYTSKPKGDDVCEN